MTRSRLVEIFVVANLSFLALDIFVAHSINQFAHKAEWVPFVFSIVAPFLLALSLLKKWGSFVGYFVGALSILIGLAGLFFHLESQFFTQMTIKSLVYTAPFVAPLAYTGIGFLLVLNRRVSSLTAEWAQWVVFFALGGFVGNFILSLCDHAQNGFFERTEWIPVVSSAMAVGFLFVALFNKDKRFLNLCLMILGVQILVGTLGFYFHMTLSLAGTSSSLFEKLIYGPPVFAPLLFPNLSILAGIGVWSLRGYNQEKGCDSAQASQAQLY